MNEREPVLVPVLVTFVGTVEVMVAQDCHLPTMATVRTALAYVTPEGFTIDRVDDWELLPR